MTLAEVEAGTLNMRDVLFSSRSNKLCPAELEESQLIPGLEEYIPFNTEPNR